MKYTILLQLEEIVKSRLSNRKLLHNKSNNSNIWDAALLSILEDIKQLRKAI